MRENTRKTFIFFALFAVFLWIGVKFLLPLSFPFLLGIGLALLAEPATQVFLHRLHLPRPAACAISVSGVLLLSVGALLLVLTFLLRRIGALSDILPAMAQAAKQGTEALRNWLLQACAQLPERLAATATGMIDNLFSNSTSLLEQAALRLPEMAGQLLGGLSAGILWLLTAVICAYMVSARLPKLKNALTAVLPDTWLHHYRPAWIRLRQALGGWILAELKLAGVAFCFLAVGFWLLRISNGLSWAFLTTLVDIFPILGVGTVLIPWGIVCLLQGDRIRGIGILTLFVVIWLVRSVLEPKWIGKNIGLDPLVTLLAIYVGFQLFGIGGMLLSPILALGIIWLFKEAKP